MPDGSLEAIEEGDAAGRPVNEVRVWISHEASRGTFSSLYYAITEMEAEHSVWKLPLIEILLAIPRVLARHAGVFEEQRTMTKIGVLRGNSWLEIEIGADRESGPLVSRLPP